MTAPDEEQPREGRDARGTRSTRLVAVLGGAVCAFAAATLAAQGDPPLTPLHDLVHRVTPQAAGSGEWCPGTEGEGSAGSAPAPSDCSGNDVSREAGMARPPRWSAGWAR